MLDPYPGYPATGAVGRTDLDCDDYTTLGDAMVVLRYEAGLDPGVPVGCPQLGWVMD